MRNQPKKGALNPAQIQHQNKHCKHMGSRFLQLCSDLSHAAFAFCQTEFALNFHTFTFVFVVLKFVSAFALFGPSQSRTGEADPPLFAIAEIIPVAIDLRNL